MKKEEHKSVKQDEDTLKDEQAAPTIAQRLHRADTILARAALLLLFCLAFVLSALPWGRAIVRTSLLLPALISVSESAALSQTGDPVRFIRTTLHTPGGPIFLDIYEPVTPPPPIPGKRAAIINIVGVGDNRTAPQLVNLSRSFAREGIVVVNMSTPALFNFQVLPQDSEAVVQTFEMLAHRSDVSPDRIGIIGFSAGSTLACIAATDPRIRDRLAFITLFGGYFDATSLLRESGRRALIVDGHTQPWQPNYVPLQVLANAMSSALSPSENTLFQQAFAPNGSPLSASAQSQLSPAAAAAYHLLEGDQPDRVDQNVAALSPQMRARLAQLSPASYIAKIHTPIYLLHDRSDQYVPFTQSRQFAAALARIHHPYDFAEFGIFQHIEVRSNLSFSQLLGDGLPLSRILSKMLLFAS